MDSGGQEGRRGKADVNEESGHSDSERLCFSCRSIPFAASGFYGSVSERRTLIFRQRLLLPEVLVRSEQCFLCTKIVEFFHEWNGRKFGNQGPDLENATAALDMHLLDMGNPKGGLVRIRVFLIVPNSSDKLRPYEAYLQFQRCSQPPLKVENFCKEGSLCDWESGEEQAYSGRIRSLVADTRLFRKWKNTCCNIHGKDCDSIFTHERRPPRLRLIDVEKRCVVDCNIDVENRYVVDSAVNISYTALSYVWGNATLPQLKTSTDGQFRQAGSLTTEMLPSTIDDAIELSKSLEYQYIWIDCLCIMQDDAADKREFIPQMDLIFGFASVTIVAASGFNAEAGLPGIKPGLRIHIQEPFKISGISILRTLDPVGSEDNSSYLAESEWYKRGWTFQEKIFSKRALIFTPEQVYWECQKATWCEDGLWETMESSPVYRHCFNEEDFRRPWPSDVDSFERIYPKLVMEYSGRKLSFESDGLNAFEGILNAFRMEAHQDFLCALPTSFLSNALIWHCSKSLYKRRSSDETTTDCSFPSWSWVGWVGEVQWLACASLNLKTHIDLIFYYLDDNRSLRQVEATGAAQSLTQIRVKKKADKTTVNLDDIPNTVLRGSIPKNVLFFWSSTAKLLVKRGEDPNQPILCRNGKDGPKWTIEPFWIHSPSFPPDLEERGEFVVIGKCPMEGRLAVLFLT